MIVAFPGPTVKVAAIWEMVSDADAVPVDTVQVAESGENDVVAVTEK
jgi:hypothetical protein